MMNVTLSGWLAMRRDERSVVLDGLLERLPEGYVHAADVGNASGVVPQFIHRKTGVLFNLVFGDEVLIGMTERRVKRAFTVRGLSQQAMPDATAEVRSFAPARRVHVPAMLVGEVLSGHQLHQLGVANEVLTAWAVRAAGIGQVLKAFVKTGWRLPSEVEWEFAVRAAMDSLDDVAPPIAAAGRFLTSMGGRLELCSDTWHEDWGGAPGSSQSWGMGHEVVRGASNGTLVPWSAQAAWIECVWPSRRAVAAVREAIGVRPWLQL